MDQKENGPLITKPASQKRTKGKKSTPPAEESDNLKGVTAARTNEATGPMKGKSNRQTKEG